MNYIKLLTDFVTNKISVDIFINKFKSESSFRPDNEFKILDKLFSEVDIYCDATSDLFNSKININEKQLKKSAVITLKYLQTIKLLKTL